MNTLFTYNQFFGQFKAPNADELTSYVLSKDEEYIQFPWAEACELKTISCPWQEIGELIRPSLELFAKELGKPFEYGYENGWINCYERGSYQEIHCHQESDFASVFFPQEQEDDFGRFFFYDRYGNSLRPKWMEYFNFHTTHLLDVSPGDIIFFPGSVLHGVSAHRSDKVRKTFSCNYTLK